MKGLATLAFAAEASNLLLLGPPGVGKTYLVVALALRSIENGYGAYFVCAYDLMEDLGKARAEGRLDRRMRVLLIVDEFGIWPYDRESGLRRSSAWCPQVRERKHHTDVEQGLRRLGRAVGDTVIATAILSRLLHHSHVINTRGESYRLNEKQGCDGGSGQR